MSSVRFKSASIYTDINGFAEIHNRLLKPNGAGLHRIDFGPHDCWFSYKDPLTFLRFPDLAWKLSGSNRGTLNRHRHHEFIEAFEKANLDVEVMHQDFFDVETINFEGLHKKFQAMPRESLKIGSAVYRLSLRK